MHYTSRIISSWIIHCTAYLMPESPNALGYTCQNYWYFLSMNSSLLWTQEWVVILSGINRALSCMRKDGLSPASVLIGTLWATEISLDQ